MKEFIEKLIGRLEEQIFSAELYNDEFDGQTVDNLICLGNVADTANQLAEEYKDKDCSKCSKRLWYQKGYADAEKEYKVGWIPCSERLPNKEEYLKNDGRLIVTDGNRVYQSIYDIYTHHYFRTLKFYNFGAGEKSRYEIDNCVIAWMPLPEPYTVPPTEQLT